MAEKEPKTAYELAMERLRAQDRERGVEPPKPLSDAQKERIAEARREAKAKMAELEIMRRKQIAEAMGDPARIAETEEKFAIDRGRVESSLESRLAKIRRGAD